VRFTESVLGARLGGAGRYMISTVSGVTGVGEASTAVLLMRSRIMVERIEGIVKIDMRIGSKRRGDVVFTVVV